jgi:hypothetical protein
MLSKYYIDYYFTTLTTCKKKIKPKFLYKKKAARKNGRPFLFIKVITTLPFQ